MWLCSITILVFLLVARPIFLTIMQLLIVSAHMRANSHYAAKTKLHLSGGRCDKKCWVSRRWPFWCADNTRKQIKSVWRFWEHQFWTRMKGSTLLHLGQRLQWSVPRPWQQQPEVNQGAGPSSRKKSSSVHYESSLKRSIPHVSLSLDDSGKNICVDSIISNVYIKIPDSNVSLQTILSEVAAKIGESPSDLILLDSKFVEIGDDIRGMSN